LCDTGASNKLRLLATAALLLQLLLLLVVAFWEDALCMPRYTQGDMLCFIAGPT
jgi:hypothetical protein